MTARRVQIQWTQAARDGLREIPTKAAKGLFRKVGDLRHTDPRTAGRALVGPLQSCYRIKYSRYRAVYRVDEAKDERGKSVLLITVVVLVVAKREEGSRRDVYALAKKLISLAQDR